MKSSLALIMVGLVAASCYGQLDDGFDYPDGDLTLVSGGRWRRTSWPGTVGPLVANGMVKMRSNADTNAFFPNVFGGGVYEANIGFDFLSSNRGSAPSDGYWLFFGSASEINGVSDWNYRSGLVLNFNNRSGPGGRQVRVDYFGWDVHLLGYFDLDVWHQARLALRYEPHDYRVNFDFRMDDQLIRRDYFNLADPRGLNCVEIYGGEDRAGRGQLLLDNISVQAVPEPSTIMAALAGVAVALRRRSSRRHARGD